MNQPVISTFIECNRNSRFSAAGGAVRLAEPKIDFVFPEVPFPSKKIFEVMGEERIVQMVRHHHTLLRKSIIGSMFPADDKAFEAACRMTASFFIEALGGPALFSEAHGHPALRERHFRFLIDEKARDIWLMMYKKTLKAVDFPTVHLREFWEWIEALSIRMINRRTTFAAPERYRFETIAHEFGVEGAISV